MESENSIDLTIYDILPTHMVSKRKKTLWRVGEESIHFTSAD